jgi:hypothetical protein
MWCWRRCLSWSGLHGIRDRRAGRVDGHGMLLGDRREGVLAEGA